VARQYQVLDEQLAFVMGHELAHHHLGHLPCTGGSGPLGAGEAARALSSAVPLFNQPNELAADFSGTQNVLAAGTRQQGYRWTEAGGLLTMQFFMGLDQMAPVDILFSFERTHPPPQLRVPVIQQSANAWRLTGGGYLPIPSF
jgi:Zn-dependent protease with chaperone function